MNKESKRLVEICPQCLHSIIEPTSRLVFDTCGHKKCRICLLQEANGCLKCVGDSIKTSASPMQVPLRKSVITSTQELQSGKFEKEPFPRPPDRNTEKEILFPTELVKKSKGNFHHFKRLISERYFNEGGCKKEDKCCGTENIAEPNLFVSLPRHIEYYCVIHKSSLGEEQSFQEHLRCSDYEVDLFKCKKCDINFENNYKLSRHNRSHTFNSKFQCQICLKHFKDNYALRTHTRKHSGDKAFACNLCDVKFAQLWSLKRHLAKHKGEKNFVCESCDYRFLTKPELKRHMPSHSKLKAFVCKKCGAKFTFQRSLTRHISTHNVEAVILSCNFCEATFKRKDNLKRHIKNSH